MIQQFTFGEWLPDQPDLGNPGLIEARNVYPVSGAYEPFLQPVAGSTTIPGEVIGASRVILPDGTLVQLIGTREDLFAVAGGTATPSELELSVGLEEATWVFVPFGRMVWAFCAGEAPHYIPDITTGRVFEPHPGIAPRAQAAARVSDFIVAGNLEDIDSTVDSYRVRWSRFNDPAGDWTDDIATQAGAVSLPVQNGPVVAIAGGDSGLVFQRYGVSRLDYTAGASVFSRREISTGRGCVAPASVVTVAGVTYFLSDDGFFKTDGASIAPIASQRVFSWFLEQVDGILITRTQGAVDWRARCIVWSFVPAITGAGFARQLIYSWESNRWSMAELPVDWMLDTVKVGMTLEQVAAIYPNLDTMPLSLDSPTFRAQGRTFTAIIGGTISSMTGAPMEASFTTGEFQPEPGYRCCVNGVAALIENPDANCRIALAARDSAKGEAMRWTIEHPEGADGFAHPTIDGRYVRARVVVPAGSPWTKAQGIQAEYVRTGRA